MMEIVATPSNRSSSALLQAAETKISFTGPVLPPALTSNSPASVKSNMISSTAWFDSVP